MILKGILTVQLFATAFLLVYICNSVLVGENAVHYVSSSHEVSKIVLNQDNLGLVQVIYAMLYNWATLLSRVQWISLCNVMSP